MLSPWRDATGSLERAMSRWIPSKRISKMQWKRLYSGHFQTNELDEVVSVNAEKNNDFFFFNDVPGLLYW